MNRLPLKINQRQGLAGRRELRSGFFLVIVLVVIAVATLAVYSFTELMLAQDDAAYLANDQVQSRVSSESAIELIRVVLSESPVQRNASGGLYNNPNLFQAVPINHDDVSLRPNSFSVLAPAMDVDGFTGQVRYGLQDESARLNINALRVLEENSSTVLPLAAASDVPLDSENIATTLLLALPGMTIDVAESILDWIDEDDETRTLGAELDYYDTLPTPYAPTNGPISSIDELLLVRGVTPTLLYGADVNRNGVVDPDEEQRFSVSGDTPAALGWAPYLTVHGIEANKTIDGSPRINANQDNLESLLEQLQETGLDEVYTSFIVAYRISGQASAGGLNADQNNAPDGDSIQGDNAPAGATGNLSWSPDLLDELDLNSGGGVQINQLLDLVGATVTVGQGVSVRTYQSPFTDDRAGYETYLPDLMNSVTTQDSEIIPGRINLNECPGELLRGIPTLSEEVVTEILETRDPTSTDLGRRSETWLLAEGLVTLDQMRLLTPLLCGRGDVFRAQIVGYQDETGIAHRVSAIVDATTANPKLISLRNLTHLGRGFDFSTLGSRVADGSRVAN